MSEQRVAKPEIMASPAPLPSESREVAARIAHAKGKGLFGGIALILRERWTAWVEEKVQSPIERRLKVRESLAKTHTKTLEAEHTLEEMLRRRRMGEGETTGVRREPVLPEIVTSEVQPPVSVHYSSSQIHSLALRSLVSLGADATGEEWEDERKRLFQTLPPNVAQEVDRRLNELRNATQ